LTWCAVGSVVVDVEIHGPRGNVKLKALIDTGFYEDVITVPERVRGLGIEFRYERVRRFPTVGLSRLGTVAARLWWRVP